MWATVSGVPKTFQMSACRATIRSVFCSPAAADHDRHVRCDRARLDPQVVERVAAAGRAGDLAAVEQGPDRRDGLGEPVEALAEPVPKSMPNA